MFMGIKANKILKINDEKEIEEMLKSEEDKVDIFIKRVREEALKQIKKKPQHKKEILERLDVIDRVYRGLCSKFLGDYMSYTKGDNNSI